jgi:hypothetical protein
LLRIVAARRDGIPAMIEENPPLIPRPDEMETGGTEIGPAR